MYLYYSYARCKEKNHRSFLVFQGQISFFMNIDVTTLCHVQSNASEPRSGLCKLHFMFFTMLFPFHEHQNNSLHSYIIQSDWK